mgnify:CR=1 FL=1
MHEHPIIEISFLAISLADKDITCMFTGMWLARQKAHYALFFADGQIGFFVKSLGRIKAYGVSNFGKENLENFLAAGGKPVTNQVMFLGQTSDTH